MKPFTVAALPLFALASASFAKAPADPAIVRVRLETTAGPITLALDAGHAPQTVANFMAYVDDGRLDGTTFYRASRGKTDPGKGFIQGGIGTEVRRKLPPLPFESTNQTGLHHIDGTVSMARAQDSNLASCNFSILIGPHPWLDAHGTSPGYAAFGKTVGDVTAVKRILAMPTGGGEGAMRGQMLYQPVKIIRAVRLNGVAQPTGRIKTWLIKLPVRKVR